MLEDGCTTAAIGRMVEMCVVAQKRSALPVQP